MARFHNKKKVFGKPIAKKQPTVDHITGDKIPKSSVFAKENCRVLSVSSLCKIARITVLPNTASDDKACTLVGTAAYVPPEDLNSSPATFG